ncbi:MAG TPA: LamG domain-containing protein [Flavobacterium sp.]|nr:LamG domain-containing protein [Flavobacterium sp.]
MKKLIKFSFLLVAVTAIVFASCQHEESEITQSPTALSKDSELTTKLARIAMNNTEIDNFIDNTSAFSIKLPFGVIANGQQVTVNTIADYQTVKDIFNASATDVDSSQLLFPVTLLYSDYSERIVHNQGEFDARIDDPIDPDPINCLTLQYPVTISVYDYNLQSSHVVTLHSGLEMLGFLTTLTSAQVFQINYPVYGLDQNNVSVAINSNAALQNAINGAINNCNCENPEILTSDLILYMPFGNELVDLTGNSMPTISGNYHYVTDRSGNANGAFSFDDGADSGLNSIQTYQVPVGNLMQNDNFTLSLWYNRQVPAPISGQVEQLINSQAIILMLGNNMENGNMGPWLLGGGDGVIDPSWATANLQDEMNVWHHIAITYNGTQHLISLYRDGILRAAYVNTSPFPATIIGMSFGNKYKGYLDDVRGYKRALTQAEIQQLHELPGDNNHCMH